MKSGLIIIVIIFLFTLTTGLAADSRTNSFSLTPEFMLSQAPISESMLYSTYFGGDDRRSLDDRGADTCIGPDGSIYCLIWTNTEYWPLVNAYRGTLEGTGDMILIKLSADGSEYQYCSFLGGNGDDLGKQMEIDDFGNVYIAGRTDSTDLATPGAFDETFNGGYDIFVMKFNPSTNTPHYTTYIGGSGNDVAESLAIDSNGNVYVTGWTRSSDFPTDNALDSQLNGSVDAFVLKLNSAGTELAFSTFLGGEETDSGYDVALGVNDEICVTGLTSSQDFYCSEGAVDRTLNGSDDAFICRLASDGSEILASTYIGGSGNEYGSFCVVDESGNMLVTGWTQSSDFIKVNPFMDSLMGGKDVFLQKISPNGTSISYSTYIGGTDNEEPFGIALDEWDCVYILGGTDSDDYPMMNAQDNELSGEYLDGFYIDCFASKLEIETNRLLYSSYIGGEENEYAGMLDLDKDYNMIFCGGTTSYSFPVTDNAYQDEFFEGVCDAYLSILYDRGDMDDDLLAEYLETLEETERDNNDTDSDSMPDGWEVANSLNPLVDDSFQDPDNDQLTNSEEYWLGTDPQNSDSDGDGIPDGFEYSYDPGLLLDPNVPIPELIVYNAPVFAIIAIAIVSIPTVYFLLTSKKARTMKEEIHTQEYDENETRSALEDLTRDIPKAMDEETEFDSSKNEDSRGVDHE
ncbi:MAG: SBBP repeat-containing protein [Candidatus Sifarchaeia archaeon]